MKIYTPKGVIIVVLRIIETIHVFSVENIEVVCMLLKLCMCLFVIVFKCSTFIVLKKHKSYY